MIVEGDTWEAAQANAVSLGGNLATINDKEENDWIVDQLYGRGKASELLFEKLYIPIESERGRGQAIWLGHNDLKQRGVYEAVSGEKNIYTNWMSGEPWDSQRADKSTERYTMINLHNNGVPPGTVGGVADRQYNTQPIRDRGGAHIFYGLAEIKIDE